MKREVACEFCFPGGIAEVRAALRETALVMQGGVSRHFPLAEISEVRPGVFGLDFLHANALYRLRMDVIDALEWAARIKLLSSRPVGAKAKGSKKQGKAGLAEAMLPADDDVGDLEGTQAQLRAATGFQAGS